MTELLLCKRVVGGRVSGRAATDASLPWHDAPVFFVDVAPRDSRAFLASRESTVRACLALPESREACDVRPTQLTLT
jgi:hypothetical protein